jgi:hypothetical protein
VNERGGRCLHHFTAAGMALWFAASIIAGRREAWDAGIYWMVFYPIAILTCGLFGYYFPIGRGDGRSRCSWPSSWPWRFAMAKSATCRRSGDVFTVLALPGIAAARFASGMKKKRSD